MYILNTKNHSSVEVNNKRIEITASTADSNRIYIWIGDGFDKFDNYVAMENARLFVG